MLNHIRQGSGEPLVLIHGIGSHWQMWRPVLERVGAQRELIAVDLPGFGASPKLDREPTVPALAHELSGFLDRLGLERPHVAGNSLGGGLALELARIGRARTATALSPIGFARGREYAFASASLAGSRVAARVLRRQLAAAQGTAAGRALTMSQYIARPWRVPPRYAREMICNLADSPGFAQTLPHLGEFIWDHGDLEVPVTIAWGQRDWILIPRQGRRARRLMRRARHVWLPGCGHVPTWDDPEQVATVLLAGSRD